MAAAEQWAAAAGVGDGRRRRRAAPAAAAVEAALQGPWLRCATTASTYSNVCERLRGSQRAQKTHLFRPGFGGRALQLTFLICSEALRSLPNAEPRRSAETLGFGHRCAAAPAAVAPGRLQPCPQCAHRTQRLSDYKQQIGEAWPAAPGAWLCSPLSTWTPPRCGGWQSAAGCCQSRLRRRATGAPGAAAARRAAPAA